MVARSRNSVKDRQYNDKEKTDKRKNNHLIYKIATQTIKDRTTRSPQKCRRDVTHIWCNSSRKVILPLVFLLLFLFNFVYLRNIVVFVLNANVSITCHIIIGDRRVVVIVW